MAEVKSDSKDNVREIPTGAAKPESKSADKQLYEMIGQLESIAEVGVQEAPSQRIGPNSWLDHILRGLTWFSLIYGIAYVPSTRLTPLGVGTVGGFQSEPGETVSKRGSDAGDRGVWHDVPQSGANGDRTLC